ncbi:universal stress protein [Streptomyces sp. NPDC001657]|uniref:universal stress protein n=1 Tax=Streptomyces sp. NPDC001657 TaxID=3154522 RepID=UPI003329D8B5
MEQAVTVGLDGSAESMAAAHWAAGEALRHHRTLCLLHAWPMLSPKAVAAPSEADQNYWSKRLVDDARNELHERCPDLPLTEALVAEDATTALLRAAAESWMCSARVGWGLPKASSWATSACTWWAVRNGP